MGLFQNKEPNNARHARWCINLSMLKVVVKYEPGKKNALADSLSRIDRKDNNDLNVVNILNKLSILNENINNDKKEKNIIMLDILKNVDNYYENNIEKDICKQTLNYKNFH